MPLAGPVQLCSGARKAAQALFAPVVIVVAGVVLWHGHGSPERLLLPVPGLIAMPVCTWLLLVVGAILVTLMKRQAQAVRWSPLE